jgi:hypothetical protein
MGGDVADLTTAPAATATTIRDLNSPNNTIKPGTKVKVSGVVTSPLRWVDADTSAGYCYYRVHIVQTEPAPATLGDGMILTLSLKNSSFTDGSTLTQCKDRAKTDTVAMAMDTLAMGQMVEVEGSTLHVVELGPRGATPIVMLHGASSNLEVMRPLAERPDSSTWLAERS